MQSPHFSIITGMWFKAYWISSYIWHLTSQLLFQFYYSSGLNVFLPSRKDPCILSIMGKKKNKNTNPSKKELVKYNPSASEHEGFWLWKPQKEVVSLRKLFQSAGGFGSKRTRKAQSDPTGLLPAHRWLLTSHNIHCSHPAFAQTPQLLICKSLPSSPRPRATRCPRCQGLGLKRPPCYQGVHSPGDSSRHMTAALWYQVPQRGM